MEGVRFIHFLQSQWNHYPSVDLFTNLPQYIADPDTLCVTLFPFLLTLDRFLALRFVLTVGTVDTANNIVKWILQGERPYWWVRETKAFDNPPELTHYPLTCETGPGSPSGHATLSGAVGFVLVSFACSLIHKHAQTHHRKRFWLNVMWTMYTLLLVVVSVARMQLATHFPHQVLMGSAIGMFCGWFVWHLPLEKLSITHCWGVALFLYAWALATYFGLTVLNIDPARTLKLAMKHCSNPSFVHLTTTPWHAVYRNLALLTGAGLAVNTHQWKLITKTTLNNSQKILIACGSMIAVRTIASIPYPTNPHYVFYTCAFIKNVIFVVCCLLVIPSVVLRLSEIVTPPQSPTEDKQKFSYDRKTSTSTVLLRKTSRA